MSCPTLKSYSPELSIFNPFSAFSQHLSLFSHTFIFSFLDWLFLRIIYWFPPIEKKVLARFILCLHHPHTHFTSTFLIIQLYQDVRCINRTRCYCLNYCYATIIHKWSQYNCTSFLMQNFVFLEVSDCLYFSPTQFSNYQFFSDWRK